MPSWFSILLEVLVSLLIGGFALLIAFAVYKEYRMKHCSVSRRPRGH